MAKSKVQLKHLVGPAIVLAVMAFFVRALTRNWATFETQHLELSFGRLALGAAALVATSLLATVGWYTTLNRLGSGQKLSFVEGVALFNTSSLAKYIPGKIWSYALQMHWLSQRGISKSLTLYVNLINLLVSMVTSTGLGIGYLLLSSSEVPNSWVVTVLLAVLLVDIGSIFLSGPVFNWLLRLAQPWLKREVRSFRVPLRVMLDLHLLHLVAAQAFGLSVYLICTGIGFDLSVDASLLVMASLLIADVVGFLAVFVPSGLGVREGVMYLLLGGLASGPLGAVLPMACRLMTMLVDVLVGSVALRLLRRVGTPTSVVSAPEAK